jgi:hypothetical protein
VGTFERCVGVVAQPFDDQDLSVRMQMFNWIGQPHVTVVPSATGAAKLKTSLNKRGLKVGKSGFEKDGNGKKGFYLVFYHFHGKRDNPLSHFLFFSQPSNPFLFWDKKQHFVPIFMEEGWFAQKG